MAKRTAKISEDVWPQERDFMERPDRLKYVRKIVRPMGCVFCAARDEDKGLPNLLLYKSKHAMVIMNKYPYNSGHLMVLPARHVGEMADLSTKEYTEMQNLLRAAVEIVGKVYKFEGMNIGMNMGAAAGAGIPEHMHWHIIPRWFGDTNFFPLIAETKVLPETLEQTYARYKPHFAKLKL